MKRRKRGRRDVSIYRRQNGVYYARKWDAETGTYTDAKSTGETERGRAYVKGRAMFEAGDLRSRDDDPLLIDFLKSYWKNAREVHSGHYRSETLRIVDKCVTAFDQLRTLRRSKVRRYHLGACRTCPGHFRLPYACGESRAGFPSREPGIPAACRRFWRGPWPFQVAASVHNRLML